MRYMLMIYTPEERQGSAPDPAQMESMLAAWNDFTQTCIDRGVYVESDPLQPSATATTVSHTAGEPIVSDGPFVETTEFLGGYYVVDVKDLDRALELAAQLPGRDAQDRRGAARLGDVTASPRRRPRAGPPAACPRPAPGRASSGSGRAGAGHARSASSATSTSPRTRCRRRSSPPSSAGRSTASPRAGGVAAHRGPAQGHRPDPAGGPPRREATGRAGRPAPPHPSPRRWT